MTSDFNFDREPRGIWVRTMLSAEDCELRRIQLWFN